MKAMRGPFPEAQFVAVGGITKSTARSYLEAGALGVGSGLVGPVRSRKDSPSWNRGR